MKRRWGGKIVDPRKGYLVLEDGSVFEGLLVGRNMATCGEVVFNTSMVGYEQVVSDPSYAGQIVVMTYPLIGNYGANVNHMESSSPKVRGLVVREFCLDPEHYRLQMGIEEYLDRHKVVCLTEVDTRAVTRIIRTRGTMGGVIVESIKNIADLKIMARQALQPPPGGYVMQVTCQSITRQGTGARRVVLMDFGAKKSIATSLIQRGCQVIAVPADTTSEEIMELEPDGVVLSNGPGDPRECPYAVSSIRQLIGKVPILGICLGHQLLALALGAETYKMSFGHRGGNHPVKDLQSGKVHVTAQNHGYAVDEGSLGRSGAYVSFRNLNDSTVEGLRHSELPIISVQFHPEASPGPQDTRYLFDEFIGMIG